MHFLKKKVSFTRYKGLLNLCKSSLNLSYEDYVNFLNIIFDFYNPINNFCSKKETENILSIGKIDKKNCFIPILLQDKSNKNNDYFLKLIYKKKVVGIIFKKENFSLNRKNYCKSVFSSYSKGHPGVKNFMKLKNNFIAGPLFYCKKSLLDDKIFNIYSKYLKRKKYLDKYVVFSTRNISHLGHQELHKRIIKNNKLAICLLSTSSNKYSIEFIEKAYDELRKYYIYRNMFFFKLYLPQFYAGPKEAFLQASIFKNFGFLGFAVGRDHAGIKSFYKKYESQIFINRYKDFKLKIINFKEQYICQNCFQILLKRKTKNYCRFKENMKCKVKTLKGGDVFKLFQKRDFEHLKIYLNPILFKFIKKKIVA